MPHVTTGIPSTPGPDPAVRTGGPVPSDRPTALAAVRALLPSLAEGASARDVHRILPFEQVDALSEAGLLALTVPVDAGGPGLPAAAVADVIAAVATVDGSLAQIPHSHFVFLDAARRAGSPALLEYVFDRVLAGGRVANAQTELGGRTARDDATTLSHRDGRLVLDGTKYYCTGAIFAHILAVRALGPDGGTVVAYVPADAPGVTIDPDWNALGQRTTSSGSVTLNGVEVDPDLVLDFTAMLSGPGTYGTRAQLWHAAIDAGLARGALDLIGGLAAKARPWFEAEVDRAADDPLLVARAGELEVTVRSAEALLEVAGDAIAVAEESGTEAAVAEAALATAAATVAAGRAARRAGSDLFDFGGTRSAGAAANLDRYWRDARTHTLHDPERWKLHHLGRWALDRTAPPSHGTL